MLLSSRWLFHALGTGGKHIPEVLEEGWVPLERDFSLGKCLSHIQSSGRRREEVLEITTQDDVGMARRPEPRAELPVIDLNMYDLLAHAEFVDGAETLGCLRSEDPSKDQHSPLGTDVIICAPSL
jgi:hypothetical protein